VTTQTKIRHQRDPRIGVRFLASNSNFARNPFNQQSGVSSGNWNQFGGRLATHSEEKLFVLANLQGQRSHVGGTSSDRVPTALERGNITAGTGGRPSDLGKNIYDLCTDKVTGFYASLQRRPANRAQFAGKRDTGKSLVLRRLPLCSAKIPLPSTTRATPFLDNFFASGNNTLDSNGFRLSLGFVATNKVNVFGRYSSSSFKRPVRAFSASISVATLFRVIPLSATLPELVGPATRESLQV